MKKIFALATAVFLCTQPAMAITYGDFYAGVGLVDQQTGRIAYIPQADLDRGPALLAGKQVSTVEADRIVAALKKKNPENFDEHAPLRAETHFYAVSGSFAQDGTVVDFLSENIMKKDEFYRAECLPAEVAATTPEFSPNGALRVATNFDKGAQVSQAAHPLVGGGNFGIAMGTWIAGAIFDSLATNNDTKPVEQKLDCSQRVPFPVHTLFYNPQRDTMAAMEFVTSFVNVKDGRVVLTATTAIVKGVEIILRFMQPINYRFSPA
ncbi:hypothetical protein [Paludibacterium yongneupense]|uniref:hypothetical protein n=1 Tax=Paludibacterium yongneupense TaxID=400061 RepID=UPI00048F30AE|nr:hypothetical protein [Paludibacterium yongneupense]